MWYFAATDCKLRFGDGRVAKVGITHRVDGKLELCRNGLHASKRAIDALGLGAGPVVFCVELSNDAIHGKNKSCATERTYLAGGFDATPILREFACCVAEAALLIAGVTDQRPWDVIEAARAYARGGIDAQTLAAASAAAWDAASAAAKDAASAAASAAARDAARAAAKDAASAAAFARDAARAAAWNAASAAAWNAASAAAWAAASDEINDLLEQMLTEAMQ